LIILTIVFDFELEITPQELKLSSTNKPSFQLEFIIVPVKFFFSYKGGGESSPENECGLLWWGTL